MTLGHLFCRKYLFRVVPLCLLFAGGLTSTPSHTQPDTSVLMDSAIKSYNQGHYKKAMRQFLNVLQADPNNAEAKEYRNRCMDKIVEDELGVRAEKPDKTPFRVPTTTNEEHPLIRPARPVGRTPLPADKKTSVSPTGDKPNARSLLQQRDTLVEDYRQRVLGKESAVWLNNQRNEIEIVLYMNRLFLPMTDQLTTDAYPMMEAAVKELRAAPNKPVFLRAVDNLSPAVRHTRLDLPARRSAIVFSYLVHATLDSRRSTQEAPALAGTDLAD